MLITVIRDPSAHGCTLGRLAIDGRHECYTCEDVVRDGPKVPGETAIPAGRYRVVITRSERFSKIAGRDVFLPLLQEVPGFTGIRLHPGNTAAHTEGCLLPGLGRLPDRVTQSVAAFDRLFRQIRAAIDAGEEVWIEISQRQVLLPAEASI